MNAVQWYRVSRALHLRGIPILPKVIKGIIYLLFNSVVPFTCKIGRGSKFAYGGIGVVIHSAAVVGSRVIIGQGVTIGRQLDPKGVPTIGDDVYISGGARILGGISVGSNVIVGANAVVIRDVPDNSIVAGVPAKVIRKIDVSIFDMLENIY